MKKLIIFISLVLLGFKSESQQPVVNYTYTDTIERMYYDSMGAEHSYEPPQYLVRKIQIRDMDYQKRVNKSNRLWSRISLAFFVLGTSLMFLINP